MRMNTYATKHLAHLRHRRNITRIQLIQLGDMPKNGSSDHAASAALPPPSAPVCQFRDPPHILNRYSAHRRRSFTSSLQSVSRSPSLPRFAPSLSSSGRILVICSSHAHRSTCTSTMPSRSPRRVLLGHRPAAGHQPCRSKPVLILQRASRLRPSALFNRSRILPSCNLQ